MTGVLAVGTRKGLFLLRQKPTGDWSIGEPAFLGVPVPMVAKRPGSPVMLAALDHGHFGIKLHHSADAGESWTERSAPAFAANPESEKTDTKAPSVSLIWSLEAGMHDGRPVL